MPFFYELLSETLTDDGRLPAASSTCVRRERERPPPPQKHGRPVCLRARFSSQVSCFFGEKKLLQSRALLWGRGLFRAVRPRARLRGTGSLSLCVWSFLLLRQRVFRDSCLCLLHCEEVRGSTHDSNHAFRRVLRTWGTRYSLPHVSSGLSCTRFALMQATQLETEGSGIASLKLILSISCTCSAACRCRSHPIPGCHDAPVSRMLFLEFFKWLFWALSKQTQEGARKPRTWLTHACK